MAARSDRFPWPSHYGHFRYFEARMKSHSRVAGFTAVGDGVYDITRDNGGVLRVFVCECYAFGVAELLEVQEQLGSVNAVIINSAWCGYTKAAREHGRAEKIGLFTIAEFMGALGRQDFWNYETPSEKPRHAGG
jgi:hypothetical protein